MHYKTPQNSEIVLFHFQKLLVYVSWLTALQTLLKWSIKIKKHTRAKKKQLLRGLPTNRGNQKPDEGWKGPAGMQDNDQGAPTTGRQEPRQDALQSPRKAPWPGTRYCKGQAWGKERQRQQLKGGIGSSQILNFCPRGQATTSSGDSLDLWYNWNRRA